MSVFIYGVVMSARYSKPVTEDILALKAFYKVNPLSNQFIIDREATQS